jgi:serine/threonine-protein kinase HipA
MHDVKAGLLEELSDDHYRFIYDADYQGEPISLTMPIEKREYQFSKFPSFFEGALPEGIMLEALLRKYKLDRKDYFGQLLQVGRDLVGAISVEEIK